MKIPASYHQERLWFIHKFETGVLYDSSPGYHNIPLILDMGGPVDEEILERSIKDVIARHEALRTRIITEEDKPFQFIDLQVNFKLALMDLTGDNKKDRYNCALEAAVEISRKPFLIDRETLVRGTLILLADNKSLLVITVHHIIADKFSLAILAREIAIFYEAHRNNRTPDLPDLPIHYADFSRWQRELPEEALEFLLSYWKRKLKDKLQPLELPTDRPRSAVHTFREGRQTFSLSVASCNKIKNALQYREKETGYFVILLAVFKVLLHKYSGLEEIVVGTSVDNRHQPGTGGIIGPLANLLVLRSVLTGTMTFPEWAADLAKTVTDAFKYRDMPFDKLVLELNPEKDMSRTALFDVLFQWEKKSLPITTVKDLKINIVETNLGWGKYDLSVLMGEGEESVSGIIVYNRNYYDDASISRLIDHYGVLLERIGQDPSKEISQFSILTEMERQWILMEWNQTEADYPGDKTVQQIFEDQVEKTPDHKAVVFEDTFLTYRQLNQQANRLARYLRIQYNIKPNSLVGLMMERSLEMAAAILAVLKAGGAYLPIDAEYPEQRIRLMLGDSSVSLLLMGKEPARHFSFTYLQDLATGGLKPHRTAPRPQIKDLNSVQFPDRSLVNYEKYGKYIGQAIVKNSMSLQATRGCPYNCAYCHKIWPKTHVFRSAENIVEEVKRYHDIGIRRFVFIDDIFNLNEKNSRRFFEKIIRDNLDVQFFFPSGVRGDLLTGDYIDLMVEAGTAGLAVALETVSQRLQKLIGKNLKIDKLEKNVAYFCERYPHVILELFTMHGFPTETREEALATLDFIKRHQWIHFPYINILRIFPNTDMEKLALENGISREAILSQEDLTQNDPGETLPFDKNFTLAYQAKFLEEYFLLKERMLYVLPYQMKVLTGDEMVQKYDSYLSEKINCFDDLLNLVGIAREELSARDFAVEDRAVVPGLNERIKEIFPVKVPDEEAIKVLLLDVSQEFTCESSVVYDVVEAPLGLMYLMSNLYRQYGSRVEGKIAKSRIDFDSYNELNALINQFKPDVIGIRSLTFYKKLLHKTAALIKQWGIEVPIIAGGPYATSDYAAVLQDRNVDLVVIGEGEVTFCELIGKIVENKGKLPGEEVLKDIRGIAFIPAQEKQTGTFAREIVLLDEIKGVLARESAENPEPVNRPTDLAYTIFTSGSTGRPKGALVEHNNVVRLMFNRRFPFNFDDSDVWTMFHSYCFDFSVWEMFGALLYGGKLVMVPKKIAQTPWAFLKLLEEENVTVLNQVPTMFTNLAAEILENESKRKLALRYIIFGGEALNPAWLKPWHERYPEVKLVNMYGITETTVHVTYKEITREEMQGGRSNIGKPLPTLYCYILDKSQQLVPVGVSGEIFVGGEGVCRGYLNRPALTRERFILSLYIEDDRLYCSGDLGRWLAAGDIEYLGRIDQQVTIRGYRIECGEIESRLLAFKKIKEAVVMAKPVRDNQCLVAYLAADEEIQISEVREYLKKFLPLYMIPAYFVQLKRFPLTPSGKIDKKLLPEPETGIQLEAAYEGSRNEMQAALVKIWQEVLGIENMGIQDDFFSLGGDSIKGIRVINKIQEWLEEVVHVTVLFESPTIVELAERLIGLQQQKEDMDTDTDNRVDEVNVAEFCRAVQPLPPLGKVKSRNRTAVFILSPPRSGSTLLRIILAGHPQLFAPPELELLSFHALQDRKFALGDKFLAEGTIRAIMEIKNCGAQEAKSIMEELEEKNITTLEFYRIMQEWLGDRILVDKTPLNALGLDALKRAEACFDKPKYIHLLRNPYAVIYSFEEARLDQVFRVEQRFPARQLAEIVWLVSHRNILEFFKDIPDSRKHIVKFEDLVSRPAVIVQGICDFLELEYHDKMLQVYQDSENRMVDGIYSESRMIGDPKFSRHKRINPRVIDNWEKVHKKDFLGDITLEMALSFGYLKAKAKTPVEYMKIEPVEESEHYEVSHAQKRLWVLYWFEEEQIAYNIPSAYLFEGELNVKALEKAFETFVKRHEILRTNFIEVEGEPRQKVHEYNHERFRIEHIDLTGDRDVENRARAIADKEAITVFDLEKGPLVRLKLLYLEEYRYVLLFTMHHIIFDGWSRGVFVREIILLYNVYLEGKENPLPPLEIQYMDYSAWHNKLLKEGKLEDHQQYWWKRFKGDIPVLELPTDYPRPAVKTYNGRRLCFVLERMLGNSLKELSQSIGGSLFMVLLASVKVLLYRYTGQEDIVIGSPVAGRIHGDLENLVGFFLSMLPLRTQFSGEVGFREFLLRVKDTVLGAFEHQVYPFDCLVDDLQIERDFSRSPLFDVMLVLQNTEKGIEGGEKMKGVHVRGFFADFPLSKHDITFTFEEAEEEILLFIEYNTDLFGQSRVEQMAAHYKGIITSILKDPGVSLNQIAYLSDEEKHQLLEDFNDTTVDYPKDKTIHQLFAEQAEKTSDHIALVGSWHDALAVGGAAPPANKGEIAGKTVPKAVQLTYKELDRKSDQLAHLLRRKGVGPDTIVSMMVERSVEMIIGIIGILKAGGAYLPIDLDYPRERINYMLADSNAKVLLVAPADLVKVKEEPIEIIDISCLSINSTSTSTTGFSSLPSTLTLSKAGSANLAYVIYTSGSTGRPKGVMIEHRSVVNLVYGLRDVIYSRYSLPLPLKVTLTAPYVFDASVQQVFGVLLRGYSLYIVSELSRMDGRRLLGFFIKYGIDVSDGTPTHIRLMNGALSESGMDISGISVKHFIIGGETMPQTVVEEFLNYLQPRPPTITNVYGPTECCVDSTWFEVRPDTVGELETIPIGIPMPNYQVYILDSNQYLVPPGIPGELCISGAGVGRGYLNRPELTAEKFVLAHSSWLIADRREKKVSSPGDLPMSYELSAMNYFYKTGDLARWLPGGDIEFLGRMDHQVKIRGYRIELGEIEHQLESHEEIRDAVVIAENQSLCAYIVSEKKFEVSKLREYLLLKLPHYMIPSYFMQIEEIPLTLNGKVNRKALPEPTVFRGKTYIAPRNLIEEKLVEIWSELLGIETAVVGIHSTFFELGGDSLKAVMMTAKIHKTLHVRVPLIELFKTPTIANLAEYIKSAEEDKFISIEPVEEREYYPAPSVQKRIYFLQYIEKNNTAYNLPQGVILEGNVDKAKLEDAFSELIKRHESLRTSFHMIDDELVQRIHKDVEFEIEYYNKDNPKSRRDQHRNRAETKQIQNSNFQNSKQIILDFVRTFNLSQAPLLRVGLAEEEEKKYLLVVDSHHIVMDGTSLEILIKEFWDLYNGKILPALRLQYKDFALRQVQSVNAEVLEKQEKYWLNRFSGKLPVLNVPVDFERTETGRQNFKSDYIHFYIGKEEKEKLEKLADEKEVTLFMILLAVYNVLLLKYTGQEDIIVGIVAAGRNHSDLDRIIGMFVNTLALRNFLSFETSFSDFLQQVKQCTLEAFENQDYPFEALVDKLSVKRDMSRNPLFDTLFRLQHAARETADNHIPADLHVKPLMVTNEAIKFDLKFVAVESEQGINFSFEYSRDLFNCETIERMGEHFKNLVDEVINKPGALVSELEMLREVEKEVPVPRELKADFAL
ncbi:MAG: amino acid adenylation domain-containing protein [Candidatus Aminicenantes bacterium]|nr:amino acid adenylation domain-containing protein [Candidatus Aminicenantes bacterium]NIM81790.1 amino acid adenylation domain-containing protein [Candidatus Aminicenantes bacterium]NIN21162.1 amino acid adenylation domain-containing protein [Candidatus Aminicenantes bacterium]NIN44986.1 amino acid adenylation domain-containing protein [Candidatus Aminicenantes bacterium]NIN87800.1 amino acid adenylation domain-containing protein [Candidatus Aminicenantes bacterium]